MVYHGTNDAAFTARQYGAYLQTIRRAYQAALIFAVVPNRKIEHLAPIQAAVEALADARVVFLDYSTAFQDDDTNDYIHFNPGGAVHMGMKLAGDIQQYLRAR